MADHVIRVSGKVRPGKYIYDAKTVLRKHGQVEFHAIGGSIVTALKTSDRLVELGYATLAKVETQTLDDTREGSARIVGKLVVALQKTDRFEAIDEEWQKQREAQK